MKNSNWSIIISLDLWNQLQVSAVEESYRTTFHPLWKVFASQEEAEAALKAPEKLKFDRDYVAVE